MAEQPKNRKRVGVGRRGTRKASRTAIPQPNFSEIFFSHFEQFPRGVHYEVRQDANFRHDIQFLSSLIHDARVDFAASSYSRGSVQLALERDRWELCRPGTLSQRRLISVLSVLTIRPVEKCLFSINGLPMMPRQVQADWIERIEVQGFGEPGQWTFVIRGGDWSCQFQLPEFGFEITLRDHPPNPKSTG